MPNPVSHAVRNRARAEELLIEAQVMAQTTARLVREACELLNAPTPSAPSNVVQLRKAA